MPDWLSIPRLVDIILLGMALEAFWLLWRHRRAGAGGAPPMEWVPIPRMELHSRKFREWNTIQGL